VAGAIYGLILATSVIAVSSEYDSGNAGATAVTVVVTATVFWLAHVYAGVLALGHRRRPTWAEARGVLEREWPLVQAGILPTAILLAGPLGLLADPRAHDAAVAACLIELGATGFLAARVSGARGFAAVLSGAVALSFGLLVIVLKIAVH
jgi:hypothetical protein